MNANQLFGMMYFALYDEIIALESASYSGGATDTALEDGGSGYYALAHFGHVGKMIR